MLLLSLRCLQSGMQETDASEIELQEIDMYGKLTDISDAHLLPLFLAADAHQVLVLSRQVSRCPSHFV